MCIATKERELIHTYLFTPLCPHLSLYLSICCNPFLSSRILLYVEEKFRCTNCLLSEKKDHQPNPKQHCILSPFDLWLCVLTLRTSCFQYPLSN